MSSDWENSVVLITSQASDVPDFGSGFPIHQDDYATYLLTCAHVVEDVGGLDKVRVGTLPATVVALGQKNGCDLAVLKISRHLTGRIHELSRVASKGQQIVISGYYQNETQVKTLRRINGILGERVVLEDSQGDRTIAWDVEIDDNSRYTLQPGYSGSPVVDVKTGTTIGVISQMQGVGKQGLAISVEAVEKIWQEVPSSLLQAELERLRSEDAIVQKEIEQANKNIDKIATQLTQQDKHSSKESLRWLSKRNTIAQRVGNEAWQQTPNAEQYLQDGIEIGQFYSEIEMYLELIYYSLVTQRLNLLHEPAVEQSIPNSTLYVAALELVKRRIPNLITGDEREQLETHLDYLINRLC